MAGITLDQAQAQLDAYLAASIAVSSGQSYEINSGGSSRRLSKANLHEITAAIQFWNGEVIRLSRGRTGRVTHIEPRDDADRGGRRRGGLY